MPDNGTAGDGQGSGGIFDEFLTDVPEDARPAVEGYLKRSERFVNEKAQTAAELESKFGAYRDVDLSGYTPEQLGQVLGWYSQVSESEDAFKSWLAEAAQEQGILPTAGAGDEADDGFDVPATKAELDAYVEQAIARAISPLQETAQSLQQETQIQNVERQIAADFEKIEDEHGIKLTDEDKETIVALGESHGGQDWIPEGFKKLQAIQGDAASRFVKDRTKQPPQAIRATGAEAAPANVTDWNEVTRLAAERMRQAAQ